MAARRAALLAAATLVASAAAPRGDVDHGRRLGAILGCASCHGAALDGHLFEENADFAIAWSSNVSRIAPGWSDAELETTLRRGRRPDGSPVWFMPTFVHARLSPGDMRDLIAWLRTVPATGGDHPALRRGPAFAGALEHGFSDSAQQAERLRDRRPVDRGVAVGGGRYLAGIACAECHGPDLEGPRDPQPGDAPDLSAAAAYPPDAFRRLVKTGTGLDGKPVAGMATEEARDRLSALTDAEIDSIHRYLMARAAR